MSILGYLPSFNSATSAKRRGSTNFNSALDSLLGSDDAIDSTVSEPKASSGRVGGNKPSHSSQSKGCRGSSGQEKKRSDSDFYSSLAAQGSEDDSDDEAEVAVTADDAQKLASNMGELDDMEASLFGSLGSGGRRGSLRQPSKADSGVGSKQSKVVTKARSSSSSFSMVKSEEEQEDDQDEELMAELTKGLSASSSSSVQLAATKGLVAQQPSLPSSGGDSRVTAPEKATKDTDDLDLDDLLGDLDNGGTGGRGSGDAAEGKPPQRPKTSRGKEALVSSDRRLSTLSTDSDLFSPLDRGLSGIHEEEEGAPATKQMNVHNLEVRPATTKLTGSVPPETTRRRQSSSITDTVFDDDDGDFLSDMGLGDEGSKNNLPVTTTTTRKRSVASAPLIEGSEDQPTDKMSFSSDDFFSGLGKKLHSFSMQEPGPVAGSGSKQEESEKGDTGGLQFGAYVPSSGVARKSSLKQHPEASISEEDSVSQLNGLSVRPNTAPGKKAVRFAEDLAAENSPRPATSPGLQLNREGEHSNSSETGPKSSVGGHKRRSTVSDFTFSYPDRPPTGRGRRRDSSPALVSMFKEESEQSNPTPVREGGELLGGEALGEAEGARLPWEKKGGRRQVPVVLEDKETPPQMETHTAATHLQSPPDTQTLPAFSSSSSGSVHDGAGTSQWPTFTREEKQPTENQSLGKYKQEVERYAKEVDDLKLALHAKETELQKMSDLWKDHAALHEETADCKKSLAETEVALERALSEVKALSEREKVASHKAKEAEEAKVKAEEERDEVKSKLFELESTQHQTSVVLRGEVDCLKLKCHQVELERDQASQLVETLRRQHSAEAQAVEQSYAKRLEAVEESYKKRETRWREEQQEESVRTASKLQQAERERFDAVNALKRQLESLQMAHANEMDRMNETHQMALEDVRREHELTLQQLRKRHHQELETLKSAHSHTRTLAELSYQVESSTKEFSRLQEKLEQGHRRDLEEKEETLKAREDSLKALEERLSKVQCEHDAERSQLQGLIAKMESNLAEQNRQLEKERWQLQQEWTRLQAQQTAFDQERQVSLKKVEQDKEDLQKGKEDFLKEQKRILSQCHEERRHLALERAQLQVAQKRASEKEREELHKNVQSEAELQSSKESMKEERERISAEAAKVRAERERAARDRTRLRVEQERIEALSKELQRRSAEVQELAQTAMRVKQEGESALQSAQHAQQLAEEQLAAAQAHEMSIRDAQRQIASDRLSLVNERRELMALRKTQTCQSCARQEYVGSGVEWNTSSVGWQTNQENHHPGGLTHLPTSAASSIHSCSPPLSVSDLKEYSRHLPSLMTRSTQEFPFHAPSFSSANTGTSFKQLQLRKSLREFANAARDDIESLAEEDRFLKQLAQEH